MNFSASIAVSVLNGPTQAWLGQCVGPSSPVRRDGIVIWSTLAPDSKIGSRNVSRCGPIDRSRSRSVTAFGLIARANLGWSFGCRGQAVAARAMCCLRLGLSEGRGLVNFSDCCSFVARCSEAEARYRLDMSADIAGEHRSRRLGAGKRNRHVGRAADDLRGAVGMSCSLIADQCFQNDQELLGEHGDVRSQMVRSSNAAWFVCQAIFAGSTKWFRDLAHSFTPPASRNHNSKIIRPLSDARAWRTVAMRASKRSVDFNVKQPKPRILAAPAAPEFCVS